MDKVAVFIDGAYLEKMVGPMMGDPAFRLDFRKMSDLLAAGQERLRTYFYNCPPYVGASPTQDELDRSTKAHLFYDLLNRFPRFQVRLGQLALRGTRADGTPIFQQKRVDALLCVDLVQLALTRQISKAVLLAGDSDFMPAVEVAKQHGVLVELWHGPVTTVHRELWRACEDRIECTRELLNQVRFTPVRT